MQHDFSIQCWCQPDVRIETCEDGHPNEIVYHHDEDGDQLFYTRGPDGKVAFCPDCGEVLYSLMPDPDWMIATGNIFWRIMRNEPGMRALGFGLDIFRPDEHVDEFGIVVSFGSRRIAVDFTGRRRRRPVGDQARELSAGMITEIEQHLRSHG